MAFKEVSRVEVIEILRRWQTGVGMRALARGTGLSRNTIRKYIEAAERCGLTRDGPSPTVRKWGTVYSFPFVNVIPGCHPGTLLLKGAVAGNEYTVPEFPLTFRIGSGGASDGSAGPALALSW